MEIGGGIAANGCVIPVEGIISVPMYLNLSFYLLKFRFKFIVIIYRYYWVQV